MIHFWTTTLPPKTWFWNFWNGNIIDCITWWYCISDTVPWTVQALQWAARPACGWIESLKSRNLIKRVHEKGFESLVYLNQLKLESNELGDDSFPNGVFDRMGRLGSFWSFSGQPTQVGLRRLAYAFSTKMLISSKQNRKFKLGK